MPRTKPYQTTPLADMILTAIRGSRHNRLDLTSIHIEAAQTPSPTRVLSASPPIARRQLDRELQRMRRAKVLEYRRATKTLRAGWAEPGAGKRG